MKLLIEILSRGERIHSQVINIKKQDSNWYLGQISIDTAIDRLIREQPIKGRLPKFPPPNQKPA